MNDERPVLLDNEAVQILLDVRHRLHRDVVAIVDAEAPGRRRRTRLAPVVPTAVRAEAGWDRGDPRSAAINRLHVLDAPLDEPMANRAARLVTALQVSVADAHLGATMAEYGPSTVITSDVDDVRRMADHLDVPVRVIPV